MDERFERYFELLIVDAANGRRYAVKAPTCEADIGCIVEFDDSGAVRTGTVAEKMWCTVNGEQHRCMELLTNICPVKKIFRPTWDVSKNPDWETA